ncbi:MAG TPA: hypothetical protein VK208_13325 [Pyrinomonadaceae bacterium]|jgi:hypothetical protein|nr:hypothetical protein [Pyrinomonadaceae bacterium]
MAYLLSGLYAYTVQGVMHAQSLDNAHDYIVALAARPGETQRPLEVNRAGATLTTNAANPTPGASRPAQEMPILTAFYSINYPEPVRPPDIPNPVNPIPVQNSPSYRPNTGYYPFSEVGWMLISPLSVLASEGLPPSIGTIVGSTRINTAGYGGSGAGAGFKGKYKFDQLGGLFPFYLPSGIITIQLDAQLSHVWDYSFVQVSDNEFALAASGRAPRPGVATGTMKKIGASFWG